MPVGSKSSAINVQLTTADSLQNTPRTPTSIHVHPVALFSILDHYLRRTDSQHRVIGTLLGARHDSSSTGGGVVVEVKSAFAVLHSETDEQVAVDMEYHRSMYELCHKVNPKEVIVGWYSTGSNLNTYSALIQNFYSQETAPHQAIHVAVNTGVEAGQEAGVKAFISSPVGVFPKPENCVFTPIPVELKFHQAERSGLDLLLSSSPSTSTSPTQPSTDLEILESAIVNVSDMIDRVLAYVSAVVNGEKEGDPAVGRYLMDVLGVGIGVPGGAEGEKAQGQGEKSGFSSALQDTLMMSYLANLVRSQAEVSSRLALTAIS
ncbi:JAB1/Mov34/MPN/PAD-1 ubiquitin protease-domain-containing protein [Crepidotus variabilis]|uniref:Eukaryotic translation initiation factor 3 subunit F n=1 Tax=Crepidotus variabilis TaxID=179855 RepID=A0A9P6EF86_9AGAR|nr:JAB1/Mov34/MPN/PAD-1 ubiquitin protease-domain-containing protein [Crepidotus variabilis]